MATQGAMSTSVSTSVVVAVIVIAVIVTWWAWHVLGKPDTLHLQVFYIRQISGLIDLELGLGSAVRPELGDALLVGPPALHAFRHNSGVGEVLVVLARELQELRLLAVGQHNSSPDRRGEQSK